MQLAVGAMVCAASLLGQAPSFEAASIKPHPPPITSEYDPLVRGSQVVCLACTLHDMITSAYRVRDDQVAGCPSWLTAEHYDLEGKAAGDAPLTRDRGMLMLQSLLDERFQLAIHRETREMPVFELVVARNGLK